MLLVGTYGLCFVLQFDFPIQSIREIIILTLALHHLWYKLYQL